MRRVYGYLVRSRKIDPQVVSAFVKAGLLYEDATYHNAVFVGRDEYGAARHAHKRSTKSSEEALRMNVKGSLPQYSFHHVGTSDQLYVFEAPIDMMSFISLYPENWQEDSYVALCGVGGQAMWWMLEQDPGIRKAALCLDNDEAGHKAAARLGAELKDKGYETMALTPSLKDWNDDLLAHTMYTGVALEMR